VMIVLWIFLAALGAVFLHDIFQKKLPLLHNYPILARFRFFLIKIGPQLRQYIIANDREELPFSRDERDWIERTALGQDNYFGFGTDDQVYGIGYPIVRNAAIPYGEIPSRYHTETGADLIFQIGTGYFGCRDEEGNFSLERLVTLCEKHTQIRAIEVKLSQGAKPGKGGVLPAVKVTEEIAMIRGIKAYTDCISPNNHKEFSTPRELIHFIERIAAATGLPVGIKAAIGKLDFYEDLAIEMKNTGKGIDFFSVDGGEGGTGAAPLAFADHVSLPFKLAFMRIYQIFLKYQLCDRIVFIGSGKLGFPDRAVVALALGCDLLNVAREAMIATGCIQAKKCHTDHCPTGIATHNKWLQAGLHPDVAGKKLANFIRMFRNEIAALGHSAGYDHPSKFTMDDIEISAGPNVFKTLKELYGYDKIVYRQEALLK